MQASSLKTRSFLPLKALAFSGLLLAGFGLSGCPEEEEEASGPEPLITLLSPRGGESYKVGGTLPVKWKVKANPADTEAIESVDMQMSVDNGATWGFLQVSSVSDKSPAWGNFNWTIPESLLVSNVKVPLAGKTQCRLRVRDYGTKDTTKISTSPGTFAITAP